MRMAKNTTNILKFLNKRSIGRSETTTHWKNDMFGIRKHYYHTGLKAHYGCVNAIEFSRDEELLASGGDDRRILVWSVSKALASTETPKVPHTMKSRHNSNIFCLAFNASDGLIISGGNDGCIIIHDVATANHKETYLCEEAIYCISADPTNESVFVAASHDGKAFIYDVRSDEDPCSFSGAGDSDEPMHSVQYNPIYPQYLATIRSKDTAKLWDIRKLSRPVLDYKYSTNKYNGMGVSFNKQGDKLLVIGRWVPPLVYDVTKPRPIHEFYNTGYYSVCTIKSCCWAGPKNQFVVTGSDNFNVYMWEVPDTPTLYNYTVKSTSKVLKGHRSIVNQVRYNDAHSILASSGVEKIIKAWSPFAITHTDGAAMVAAERFVYSHEEYITMTLSPGSLLGHGDLDPNLEEDPNIIAFFDSLVQRQLEAPSDTSDASEDASGQSYNYEISSLSSSSSSDSPSDKDQRDVSRGLLSSSDGSSIEARSTYTEALRTARWGSDTSPPTDSTQITMTELIMRKNKSDLERLPAESTRNLKRRRRKSELSSPPDTDTTDSDEEENQSQRQRRVRAKERQRKRRKQKLQRILTRIGVDSVTSRLGEAEDDRAEEAVTSAQQLAELRQEQQASSQSWATLRTLRNLRDSQPDNELFGSKSNSHGRPSCTNADSDRLNGVNVGASTSSCDLQTTDKVDSPRSSHTNCETAGATAAASQTDNSSNANSESKFKSHRFKGDSKRKRTFRHPTSDSDG